jgi:hypothetical protein
VDYLVSVSGGDGSGRRWRIRARVYGRAEREDPRRRVILLLGFRFWVERERAAVVGEAGRKKKTMERKKRRASQHFYKGEEDDMRGPRGSVVKNGR